MDIRQEITDELNKVIAKLFHKDLEEIAAHPETRLKEDLNVNSKQYFPMISAMEEKFDLMIDYHYFQYEATTIQSAIDYLVAEYNEQIGE